MKHYDEASVVRKLAKNPDVTITSNGLNKPTIEVLRNSSNVGNGTWGKIDFLVNYKGYFVTFVNELKKSKTNKKISDKQLSKAEAREAKKNAKLGVNLVKSVKENIHKVKLHKK